jgi:hypothetical protein
MKTNILFISCLILFTNVFSLSLRQNKVSIKDACVDFSQYAASFNARCKDSNGEFHHATINLFKSLAFEDGKIVPGKGFAKNCEDFKVEGTNLIAKCYDIDVNFDLNELLFVDNDGKITCCK